MPTITLGFSFNDGDKVSPQSLHALVDQASIAGFALSDFGGSFTYMSYGSSRPTLARGAIHYDTTAGIEGLVYAFVSASNASVSGWLYATPRRECYCWTASAVSQGTPVFVGARGVASAEYTVYDGIGFPLINQFSGASGPDAALFITMEAAAPNSPVKCMWAGMVPSSVPLNCFGGAASAASSGNPLFVDYADPGAFKFGNPTSRNFIFGVNTLNDPAGRGAVVWGNGPCIEDIS